MRHVALRSFRYPRKQGFLRQNMYKRQKEKRYYTNTMLAGFNFTIQYTRKCLYLHIYLITSKSKVPFLCKKKNNFQNFKCPFEH